MLHRLQRRALLSCQLNAHNIASNTTSWHLVCACQLWRRWKTDQVIDIACQLWRSWKSDQVIAIACQTWRCWRCDVGGRGGRYGSDDADQGFGLVWRLTPTLTLPVNKSDSLTSTLSCTSYPYQIYQGDNKFWFNKKVRSQVSIQVYSLWKTCHLFYPKLKPSRAVELWKHWSGSERGGSTHQERCPGHPGTLWWRPSPRREPVERRKDCEASTGNWAGIWPAPHTTSDLQHVHKHTVHTENSLTFTLTTRPY